MDNTVSKYALLLALPEKHYLGTVLKLLKNENLQRIGLSVRAQMPMRNDQQVSISTQKA
jgi:hypothetical protein